MNAERLPPGPTPTSSRPPAHQVQDGGVLSYPDRQLQRKGHDPRPEADSKSPLAAACLARLVFAIRLGTAIVTLPLELPIRVAEDAAVLDLMCGGRLEVGVGPGGNLSAYEAFGLDSAERTALLSGTSRAARRLGRAAAARRRPAVSAEPGLVDRVWQATFTVEGARRAGAAGDGLMLSRTQPRPAGAPGLSLPEIQNPMIDAYLAALPQGRAPRILASRTVFVADDRKEAMRLAEIGLARLRARYARIGRATGDGSRGRTRSRRWTSIIGKPDDVIASLRGRQHAGPGHRPDGAVAFDRSAASVHPAVDRAGRRGGGARAAGWVRGTARRAHRRRRGA